jgi:hypothetical protein
MIRLAFSLALLACTSLLVQACATTVTTTAPPLVSYTPAFEHSVAAEMRSNKSPAENVMVTDYLKLRCAIHWVPTCKTLLPTLR